MVKRTDTSDFDYKRNTFLLNAFSKSMNTLIFFKASCMVYGCMASLLLSGRKNVMHLGLAVMS
jgi:hypothetical protein